MPVDHVPSGHVAESALSRIAEFPGLAARLAPVNRVLDLYQRVRQSPQGFCLENLLAQMRVGLRAGASDQARIPTSGPVVVVANHPFGMLDGAILASLLTRVRPDVKVLTNLLLSDVPELQQHCIFVDPLQTDRSVESNRRPVRQALSWLQQGGMLAMFPAGEVSHWEMLAVQIADRQWHDTAVRLIRRSGASALPVYLCGRNSVGFQLLGMVPPKLRTAFLLQEFLRQEVAADWIVFASSSGGTQAGLTAGAQAFGYNGRLLGISVDEGQAELQARVAALATETCARLGQNHLFQPEQIRVNADFCAPGYGVLTESERQAMQLFARLEGLLLDPVYTGRAAAGLIQLVRAGFFQKSDTVLFWHTGGEPALFADQYRGL